MAIEYKNLDQTEAWSVLPKHEVFLKKVLSANRLKSYEVDAGAGLHYSYATKKVDDAILDGLQTLADEQQLMEKYVAVLSGETVNTGEERRVLHHLTRGQLASDVVCNGRNLHDFYSDQLERIKLFAAEVHARRIFGSTGKAFQAVVQIGIGGSDLGPRALYLALQAFAKKEGCEKMQAFFISNVDPDDAVNVLAGLDLESTLFILVSKSGTTQETLTNEAFVLEMMKQSKIPGFDPKQHMLAVTSESSPLADSDAYRESFFIDDFIGGRYSSSSAVGAVVLSLAFGFELFQRFLNGMHEADAMALESDIRKNASLLDALIGVFERNVLKYSSTAVLPYSQALRRFPAHLQQLDMESNGKQVNRNGQNVDYATGPVIFGEPGTNGQHSFYQLLHQGTDIVPLQFIGFTKNQSRFDLLIQDSNSQQKLNANLIAQILAFALGQSNDNKNKDFPGERPSSLLYAQELTPEVLGALLAHFENKVMFQGFLWNLNSFDQEGVQLGKLLTSKILLKSGLDDSMLELIHKLDL